MPGELFVRLDDMAASATSVQTVDCGKYSEDNANPECQERQEIGMGVMVVVAVVVLVVGWIAWRWLLRRSRRAAHPDAT